MEEAAVSEANVLNPTSNSDLNPDYPLQGEPDDLSVSFAPRVGPVVVRDLGPSPHKYQLTWGARPQTVADQLRQWHKQYQHDFFTFVDYERGRSFSGNFIGKPDIQLAGFNRWSVSATFVEQTDVAMATYPSNWGVDSFFLEETESDGNALVKLDSGWTLTTDARYHGGTAYVTALPAISAEWLYDGYGFRLYAAKSSDAGQVQVFLDEVLLSTVDLYSASVVNSAIVLTQQNVSFGRHRVRLFTAGTKNSSSSGFNVNADAIEVMF
jgi:hypothetical protein